MHLLPTEIGTLDEVATAVDLEQSPADLVILSFSDSDLGGLAYAWERCGDLPSLRLASLKQLRHPMSVDLYADRVLATAKLVIVRSLGGLDYWRYGFERLAEMAARTGMALVALPGDDRPDPRLTALSTVATETVERFDRYFRAGGPENLRAALNLAATLAGAERAHAEPQAPGAAFVLAADGSTSDASIWTGPAPDIEPNALIVFYRSNLLAGDVAAVEALREALAAEHIQSVAVAVTSLKDPAAQRGVSRLIQTLRPAVILNATAFSALRDDNTSVLDAADCAVLQVAFAGSGHADWAGSARGLSPTDLAMHVVLPELDGRLFTRAVSFKEERTADARLEFSRAVHAPLADRVRYVAQLAARWVRLRGKKRAERRIAMILSDYPARGGRAGYAVGLDTSASVGAVLEDLRTAGYDVGEQSWPGDAVIRALTDAMNLRRDNGDRAVANSATCVKIWLAAYTHWFQALPAAVQRSVLKSWGPPEQDPLVSAGAFHFRTIQAGTVTIVLQPDRGSRSDAKGGYHDLTLPPRHSYIALYAWLRETRQVDAVVHMGTHGTLEWLPGKALALSGDCLPEAVLGPVPVIYPFIVNNPGEAVQAKRRIAAVTLGHLTPPLSRAGLDRPLGELETLIEEYAEAQSVDRRRVALLETEILQRAERSGLAAECGVIASDTGPAAIAKLDAQLCDIKDLSVRDALHVFGRPPEPAAIDALVTAMSANIPGLAVSDAAARIAASGAAEVQGLLAALDGRRVPPGPAGAPSRGRLDVLPTGRNLTTTDPRAIPTRTAASIGRRSADEVIRRHLQDHGDYLRAVVIDLWASASLRTGGDDIAQALALMGCVPVWDAGTGRVSGVEVLPVARLEHPRVDVTIRASGLFRDLFQSQLALFDLAVGLVAAREEADDWNPLAAARRQQASLARAFSGAPGSFGAGAAALALDGDWTSQADLGAAYLAATTHAYGRNDAGTAAPEAFAARVAAADALIHTQDDAERDLLDGDGVADAMGGFAAAAALLGAAPALYHLDTSSPEQPKARTAREAVARVARGRLANPRWIAGMLKHGHRGVAEIAQGVDALFAFAASTDAVGHALFDLVEERLFADGVTRDAMRAANPDAADAIADRLNEANRRGLWLPRRNAVYAELAAARTRPMAEAAE